MEQALSVSQLTAVIKDILEQTFPTVIVEGEISNFRPSSTGHLYFTLKDRTSSIQAVLFKGKARYLGFQPADGQLVRLSGSLSVYEARGTYQIIVERMELAGSGDILALLEERKRRLAEEGLFDTERKRTLPFLPKRIGVVTSPTGAALQDIITVITRRNPTVHIVVFPAAVQGAEAPKGIVSGIEAANRWDLADVLIVGRGGGSLEDLLPFSDEDVIRAIAASRIPVVSAVGHETDWALSDYAADLRAPTPSAAAELVCPRLSDIEERVEAAIRELRLSITSRVEQLRLLAAAFDPEDLELRFRRIAQPRMLRFDDAKETLIRSITDTLNNSRQRLALAVSKLEAASPQAILERGYAMIRDMKTGTLIRSAQAVVPGQILMIQPAEGSFTAAVKECCDEKI